MEKPTSSLILVLAGYLIMSAAVAQSSTDTIPLIPTNMILDYDSSHVDSNLRPGDSGVLRVVIQNTGGQAAEDVELWIPGTPQIHVNNKWHMGRIEAGESKTVSRVIEISDDARIGLHTLQVKITYDGFDSKGDRKNNQLTKWEIPLRIYGNPNFQAHPAQTTFLKGVPSDLVLECNTENHVRDVSAILSSDCITVFGSTKNYVGQLSKKQNFTLSYRINPDTIGMCEASVTLSYTDESGNAATDNLIFGLNIQDPDVDLRVTGVNYTQMSPGGTSVLIIKLKNMGSESANDVTVSLDLSDPFTPVQTAEKYVDEFKEGETRELKFMFLVGSGAETKAYKIPLGIEYEIGETRYKINKSIGVDVSGKVQLEIISVEVRRDKLQIEVANVGTRTAYAVKAILKTHHLNKTETEIAYKDDIKPNKPATFSFEIPKEKKGDLILEYSGVNNERVEIKESVDIPGPEVTESSGGGGFPLWGVAIIVVIIVAVMYKLRNQF